MKKALCPGATRSRTWLRQRAISVVCRSGCSRPWLLNHHAACLFYVSVNLPVNLPGGLGAVHALTLGLPQELPALPLRDRVEENPLVDQVEARLQQDAPARSVPDREFLRVCLQVWNYSVDDAARVAGNFAAFRSEHGWPYSISAKDVEPELRSQVHWLFDPPTQAHTTVSAAHAQTHTRTHAHTHTQTFIFRDQRVH